MLLTTPKVKSKDEKMPPKTVVFVVDRSGSMSGKKIEQARAAAKYVLNNLRKGDLFNIVAYDSQVEAFRPELQRFDEESRKAALGFIEGDAHSADTLILYLCRRPGMRRSYLYIGALVGTALLPPQSICVIRLCDAISFFQVSSVVSSISRFHFSHTAIFSAMCF